MTHNCAFVGYLLIIVYFGAVFPIETVYPTVDSLRTTFQQHFNTPRYTSEQKQPTQKFINQSFYDMHLNVYQHTLTKGEGLNIIGILPGYHYKTVLDQQILLGAHYDTVTSTNGVNDNGSGMVALLETAKILSEQAKECQFNHTILFVAFDLEELDLFGSDMFVKEWLLSYLKQNQAPQFQGAIILETILNYDSTNGSQIIPTGFDYLFPNEADKVTNRGLKGDFITLASRSGKGMEIETKLAVKFKDVYNNIIAASPPSSISPWLVHTEIPGFMLTENPSFFLHLLRSDHTSFWVGANNISFPSILLTDTAEFRSQCYHKSCDDQSMLTDDRLNFLLVTIKSLVKTLSDLGQINQCGSTASTVSQFNSFIITFNIILFIYLSI